LIDLKTRAVAPFPPDARTFHNIYKLQKHVLLRHQSYLIVFMGNKNLRFWQITRVKLRPPKHALSANLDFRSTKRKKQSKKNECVFNSYTILMPPIFYHLKTRYFAKNHPMHIPAKFAYKCFNCFR
jgi:hypothetical protein